jgi:hypothetical protein
VFEPAHREPPVARELPEDGSDCTVGGLTAWPHFEPGSLVMLVALARYLRRHQVATAFHSRAFDRNAKLALIVLISSIVTPVST